MVERFIGGRMKTPGKTMLLPVIILLILLTGRESLASETLTGSSLSTPKILFTLISDYDHRIPRYASACPAYSGKKIDPQLLRIHSQCVDRESRQSFYDFIEPGQQFIVFSKDGFETLIWENLDVQDGSPLYIIPTPSKPSVDFTRVEFCNQVFNRVFHLLFGNFRFLCIGPDSYGGRFHQVYEIPKERRKLSIKPLPAGDEAECARIQVFTPGEYEKFKKFIMGKRTVIDGDKLNSYMKKKYSFVIISPDSNIIPGKIPPICMKFKTGKLVIPEIITTSKKESQVKTNIFILSHREKGIKGFHRIWYGDSKDVTYNVYGFPKKLTVIGGEIPSGSGGGEIFPTDTTSAATVIPLYINSNDDIDDILKFRFPMFGTLFLLLLLVIIEKSKMENEKKETYKIFLLFVFLAFFISYIPLTDYLMEKQKEGGKAGECYGNCKNLMSGLNIYLPDHDRYPETLDALFPYYINKPSPCPASSANETTYIYLPYKTEYHNCIVSCKSRHTDYIKSNRHLVVFPMCGENRVVPDNGKEG